MTLIVRPLLLALASACLVACQPSRPNVADGPSRTRLVLTPTAIAVLSSDHDSHGLPGAICMGGPFGRTALYLKFPNTWRARGPALRAFVTLSPRDGAARDEHPVAIEAWRVTSDWQPAGLQRWSDKPELAPPSARATTTNTPPREFRVDVTELVHFAEQNPERDFGFALLSPAGSGHGATFAAGMAGDVAPRLEVYLR